MSGFRQAIISDLHGNLEATLAVLIDIQRVGAMEIVCLGDLISYGPDPVPVVELMQEMADVVLQGNHDRDAVGGGELAYPSGLLPQMERFRELLHTDPRAAAAGEYLQSCPTSHSVDSTLYVHATPRNHLYEYLFPEDIYNLKKMAKIAACFQTLCFVGHSHVPGIFVHTDYGLGEFNFLSPADCHSQFRLGSQRVICNVGSVGQPRDGDPRACYALFDGDTIAFRRVDYDRELTIQKIKRNGPDGFQVDRLRDGR